MARRKIKWELGVIIVLVFVLPRAAWFCRHYASG